LPHTGNRQADERNAEGMKIRLRLDRHSIENSPTPRHCPTCHEKR
jgi:hypothetical protein